MNLEKSIIVLRDWARKFDISLPSSDEELLNLEYLKHNDGFIFYIPEEICILQKLEKLILDNNSIHSISVLPKKLRHLSLNGNKISLIDDDIFLGLNELKFLLLSNNQISSLPKSIAQLEKLVVLNLSNNKLENVDVVFENPTLKFLNLQGNKDIAELSIPQKKELAILNLTSTGIKKLTMDNFKNLYVGFLMMCDITVKDVDFSFFSVFKNGLIIAKEEHQSLKSFFVFKLFLLRTMIRDLFKKVLGEKNGKINNGRDKG